MPNHEKLPLERPSLIHHFTVGGMGGYITTSCYPDGRLAEVFLVVHRIGGLERGMCNALAIMISTALQYGVPLKKIVDKLENMRFEPQGLTGNPAIPMARSLCDYLGRYLRLKFLDSKKENQHETVENTAITNRDDLDVAGHPHPGHPHHEPGCDPPEPV